MKLKIGPREWTVKVEDSPIAVGPDMASGDCQPHIQQIRIYKRGPAPDKLATLAHETFHAWAAAVGVPHGGQEECANWFGTVVAQFVLDLLRDLHGLEEVLGVPIETLFAPDYRRDLEHDRYRSKRLAELERLLDIDAGKIIDRLKKRRNKIKR